MTKARILADLGAVTSSATELNYSDALTSAAVGLTDSQTLTNKTLTSPTIGNLSNVTGTLPVGVTGGSGLDAAPHPTSTYGYFGSAANAYSNGFQFSATPLQSGFTHSTSTNNERIYPNSDGLYFITYEIVFYNEPPTSSESDAGYISFMENNSTTLKNLLCSYQVDNVTSYHESQTWSTSFLYNMTTSGSGTSGSYWNVTQSSHWSLGGYSEHVNVVIIKLKD